MTLRVGALVYDVSQGLGILAKSFVDAGVVTSVAVVAHGRRPANGWYPESLHLGTLRLTEELKAWARGLDVLLAFETFFVWGLVPFCREHHIKTALCPMYECSPAPLPYAPDLIIAPSLLDERYYPGSVYLPVPVDVPWRQRERAEVFVHNAGHGGLLGRNGTAELLEAWPMVRSPARLILRCQEGVALRLEDRRVDHVRGTMPYDGLFAEGDVFVFPEKFNGLSLPLQEARAAGMLVMGTDRFPMNAWGFLPTEVEVPAGRKYNDGSGWTAQGCRFLNPLIPVAGYKKSRVSSRCNEFDEAIVEPRAIAAKVDEWYGADIRDYSRRGREWAERNSWPAIKPEYLKVLAP